MLTFDEATHVYRENGIWRPSNTQILRAEGYYDTRWFTQESRDRGSAVHLAIQLLEEGRLDWATVDEVVLPYVRAYEAFRNEMDFVPIFIEAMGCHPIYLYAGRPDVVGILNDNELTIPDYKTGVRQDWMALQLAGYAELLPYLQGYDEALIEYGEILKQRPHRYTIELNKRKRYHLHEYKERGDRATYLAAVNQYYWKWNHKYDGYGEAAA